MKTKITRYLIYFFFAILFITSCGPCRVPLPQIYLQPNISYGGRTVAITRNPANDTDFIVASDAGGLFRTKDAGADWTQVSDSTTFGFNDVKYCYANPSIVVAAAAQDSKTTNGGGVWRSTDSGTTWSQVALSPPAGAQYAAYLSAYCVTNETGADKMWLGTNFGLAYSKDKGASWKFVDSSVNYDNDEVYAVLAPAKNRIIILTYEGVKVSTNGGINWIFTNNAIPGFLPYCTQSQLASSPLNNNDIFLACQYIPADGNWHVGLYASYDTGHFWTNIIDIQKNENRAPICRTAMSLDKKATDFDVYFSDGQCTFKRGTFVNGTIPTLADSWMTLNIPHCDLCDLSFRSDGRSPALLTGDGGIMVTADNGANWKMTGGGVHGYNALEVLQVTGQRHNQDSNSDLYFASWDNDIWASDNGGETWPDSTCCEGYDLCINRSYLSQANTKLTGVDCGNCWNFMSGPLLANNTNFPNPQYCTGAPLLLMPGVYLESDSIPGSPLENAFSLTINTGGSWNTVYSFQNHDYNFSSVVNVHHRPVIFTPVLYSGTTINGNPIAGIKKIVGVLGPGTPVVSDITGFGSLGNSGIFGADIFNPNHLIVPDIISDSVKVTIDGGSSWNTDANLTHLVTQSGKYYFQNGQPNIFDQITAIAFDPTQPGHILVGTYQAGIFSSCDNGASWQPVKGTPLIPNISSFYFKNSNIVVVSSWGRGLTELLLPTCPSSPSFHIQSRYHDEEPLIYWEGAMIPFSQIHNPDACPRCVFYLVEQGDISEVNISKDNNSIIGISTTNGKIAGYTYEGKKVETIPFRIAKSDKKYEAGSDKRLSELLDKGFSIKGIYAEEKIFKGIILSKKDISPAELPKVRELKSFIKAYPVHEKGNDVIKGIQVRGKGFEKEPPFEVSVDRKRVDSKNINPSFDKDGNFVFYLNLPFAPGRHTLIVEQKTSQGIVKEATYFAIPLDDHR